MELFRIWSLCSSAHCPPAYTPITAMIWLTNYHWSYVSFPLHKLSLTDPLSRSTVLSTAACSLAKSPEENSTLPFLLLPICYKSVDAASKLFVGFPSSLLNSLGPVSNISLVSWILASLSCCVSSTMYLHLPLVSTLLGLSPFTTETPQYQNRNTVSTIYLLIGRGDPLISEMTTILLFSDKFLKELEVGTKRHQLQLTTLLF